MATYTSGSVSVGGLSGVDVDFEDLIDKLYKIESIQAEQLLDWYSDWEIRLDAFSQVRESLVSLQTSLTSLNSVDKFLVKTGASSNESIVGATVGSNAVAGSYSLEVGQLATSAVWSIGTGLEAKDSVVNDSGSEGTFSYTYKGETRSIKVPSGATMEQLKNLINNDGENLGVRAQLIQSGDEIVFQLSGLDTGASATLEITNTTNLNGLGLTQEGLWGYAQTGTDGNGDPVYTTNELTSLASYASTTEAINISEMAKTFVFDVTSDDGNGNLSSETYSVKLAAGGSLDDLVSAINAKTAETGVTAETRQNSDGTYSLHLSTASSSDIVTVGGGSLDGYASMLNTTNWQVQYGQNAAIRVQGWPASGWLEVSSNTVSDVVDGVTFNLRSEGKATVTVELDSDAIEANIQSFVDAVNQFRSLILSLTKVTEDTGIDPDYAENQSEMQNGSALTGNYGIQLLSSNLKQAVATSAKGFTYAQEIEGKMYGDLFNSLSQIGIITDTDESSPTFGLLVINTETTVDGVTAVQSTGTFTLKEALAKDAEAVAKLFAANGEAKSNSSAFAVNSTVKTITEPGTYDVSYTVGSDGTIESATINGKDAKIDGNTVSLVRSDPETSDSSVATAISNGKVEGEYMIDVLREATKSTTTVATEADSRTDAIFEGDSTDTLDFSYTFNGETRTIEISAGTTLDALVNTINKDSANPGVVAKVAATDDDPAKYNLVLEAKSTGENSVIDVLIGTPTGNGAGALATAATTEEAGVNAQYKAWKTGDAEPAGYAESATNSVSVVSGLTVTLQGTGTATIKAAKHNDADGIVLDIYDLTPGATVEGTVSVREGKINEILGMLEGTEGILGSNGTLAILENNYKEIMTNIKDKIQKEDERLNKWLRLTKERFARLEATLSEYMNLQSTIESQVEQLKSNSS